MDRYALGHWIRGRLKVKGLDLMVPMAEAGDIVDPELMNAREGPELLSWIFWFAGWSTQECLSADQAREFALTILAAKFGIEASDSAVLGTVWDKMVRILFISFSQHKQTLQRLNVTDFEDFESRFYGTLLEGSITWFSHKDIKDATCNFSRKIGEGHVNEMFQGRLPDGRNVAVTRYKKVAKNTLEDVVREVKIHQRLARSEELSAMVGFCLDEEDPLLVYEHVPYGTLEEVLEGELESADSSDEFLGGLIWKARLQIGIDVANAIKQLHEQMVYHQDVKSSNIFLTNPSCGYAKLGGFGFATEVPEESGGCIRTRARGSRGYMDPHQKSSGILSEKSDVYSLGVVLMELVTGKKAWDPKRRQSLLPKLVTKKMKSEKLSEILDPYVFVPCNVCRIICEFCLKKMLWGVIELAIDCCSPLPSHRPTIQVVIERLLDIQLVGDHPSREREDCSSSS